MKSIGQDLHLPPRTSPKQITHCFRRCICLPQLSRLAENLDCFTFIIGASNYEEVGIYVTENNEDFSVNPSVEKFFDYKAFGKYIGDAYYGEFVDGGFIYNDTDTSLLDILYQDEPMTMGGM